MLFEFIQNNIGSIAVGLVVAALLALAAWRIIADKKQGKSSCGSSCNSCPNSALCHAKRDNAEK